MIFWTAWRLRCFPTLTDEQVGDFGKGNSEAELLHFETWMNTRAP